MHKVRFISRSDSSSTARIILDQTFSLAEVASQRVTFSYQPGSVDDHKLINQLAGMVNVPAFLVTLGGMFFMRGAAFMVRMESLNVSHPFWNALLETCRVQVGKGAYISLLTFIVFGTFIVASMLAYFTRFGRNVYAIGGNESSARLMGLPVARTRIGVYALSGLCMSLAGVISVMYMGSGDPARAVGMELDVIAAVVIGGTLLSGGAGHLPGTFLGVLIYSVIAKIAMRCNLDSAWLRIVTGLLLLAFVVIQTFLSSSVFTRSADDRQTYGR